MKDSWNNASHSENENMPLENGDAKLCQDIIKRVKKSPVDTMQRASSLCRISEIDLECSSGCLDRVLVILLVALLQSIVARVSRDIIPLDILIHM
jgi:hypothetical protein